MARTFDTHRGISLRSIVFTFTRLVLGTILIWKGFVFINDTANLKSMIAKSGIVVFSKNEAAFALIITILTLLCGFFIFVGLFTRLFSIIQIPILFLAVFFVAIKDISSNTSEVIISLVALLLLIFFAFKGSGNLSADEYFRRGAEIDRRAKLPV